MKQMKQMLIINIVVVALNIFVSTYFLGNNQAQAFNHDNTTNIAYALDGIALALKDIASALRER